MSYLAVRMRAISLVMACASVGFPSASTVSKYGHFSANSRVASVVMRVMRAPTWKSRMRLAAASACTNAVSSPKLNDQHALGAFHRHDRLALFLLRLRLAPHDHLLLSGPFLRAQLGFVPTPPISKRRHLANVDKPPMWRIAASMWRKADGRAHGRAVPFHVVHVHPYRPCARSRRRALGQFLAASANLFRFQRWSR